MKKMKKNFLLIIVFFLSIGFAILSSNLSVLSNIVIADASWNVHLYRPEVHDTNTEGATYSLNSDKDELTVTANLDKPGDYVTYDFYIVNDGTIDAIIDSFTISGLDSNYIEYSLTYYSGASVSENDLLKPKTSKRLKLYVSYKYNVNSFIDVSNMSGTISFNFIQPMDSELVWNYDYSEEIQKFTAPKAGTYKIETWGAQGGSYDETSFGGYGGYSTGTVSLNKNDSLYVSVGGSGITGKDYVLLNGGYNGGGSAIGISDPVYVSSGGGATSIYTSSNVAICEGMNKNISAEQLNDDIYEENDSIIINRKSNLSIYFCNRPARSIGEYYKVEWRGSGLSDSRIEYDSADYLVGESGWTKNGGTEIYYKRVTDNLVEVWYKITGNSRISELRMQTHGAPIIIQSKRIIKINDPLIVSGGGGGSNYYWRYQSSGGAGGGYVGNSASEIVSPYDYGWEGISTGGTQSSGGQGFLSNTYSEPTRDGLFGVGGYGSVGSARTSGAGGGYWGGGASSRQAAGGGSGYIGNSLLSNKVMYCYNCTESSDTNTKTISTTNVSETPTSNYAKIGNGYARITYVG